MVKSSVLSRKYVDIRKPMHPIFPGQDISPDFSAGVYCTGGGVRCAIDAS